MRTLNALAGGSEVSYLVSKFARMGIWPLFLSLAVTVGGLLGPLELWIARKGDGDPAAVRCHFRIWMVDIAIGETLTVLGATEQEWSSGTFGHSSGSRDDSHRLLGSPERLPASQPACRKP